MKYGPHNPAPEFVKVGQAVMAKRNLPEISKKVVEGMVGVVFERANAYGDGGGPMVLFFNGCRGNVYPGDVVQISSMAH